MSMNQKTAAALTWWVLLAFVLAFWLVVGWMIYYWVGW